MTPAGTSHELDVHNEWEENTHTHTQYNGGLLPDVILLFDPMLFPSGNPFKEGLGAF